MCPACPYARMDRGRNGGARDARRTVGMRVLLCDDVEDIRFMLRVSLRNDPCFEVVGEAANGLQAIEQAHALRPDLVLLDLGMPVMDGLEALPLIREAAPDCCVIVLSGFDAGQLSSQAVGRGAEAYIEKGTSVRDIVRRIKEVVVCSGRGSLGRRIAPAGP
jgi:DNA-binding NarL/FixJ family response regulator